MVGILGGSESTLQTLVNWAIMLGLFMFVLPKMYFYQIFSKLEVSALKLEGLSTKAQTDILKRVDKFNVNPKVAKSKLRSFVEFFMIPPVDIDPFGIVRKLEHVIDQGEQRFLDMAKELAPKANELQQRNINMGLQAAAMLHTLSKIVRHFVETAKKFNNIQIAMIIQMQMPILEKMAEAEYDGMETFMKGLPIGDAAGPLAVAGLLPREGREIAKDTVAVTEKMWNRNITFIKAKGPGGTTGTLGHAVEKACHGKRIVKIITIDAAQKLEGEKTGAVAEGVGVAMGGAGVERSQIEEIAVKLKIPIDAIAIKMSQFQAIKPMPIKILKGVEKARELLKMRVEETPKGSNIVVIGVGNTCGIPNTNKSLNTTIDAIKKEARRKRVEEKEKRKKGLFGRRKQRKGGDYEEDDDIQEAAPFGGGSFGMFMSFLQSRLGSRF